MITLISTEQLSKLKSKDLVPLQCNVCQETFHKAKKYINVALNPNRRESLNYCSRKCSYIGQKRENKFDCTNCGQVLSKLPSQSNRSTNHFCSRSCAAQHRNVNKKYGSRRSKLEVWLEYELTKLYPNLEIHFNNKNAINSELDIYIPSLSLAFELNGIFHYEPIFGKDKFDQIQNNDDRKFQACLECKIELCIINTTEQRYFKESTGLKYLSIIKKIINSKSL